MFLDEKPHDKLGNRSKLPEADKGNLQLTSYFVVKTKSFPLQTRNRTKMSLAPLLFNIVLEARGRANGQDKIKSIQIGKEI